MMTDFLQSVVGDLNIQPLIWIALLLLGGWTVTALLQRYLPQLANRLPARTRSRLLSAIPGVSILLNLSVILTSLVILLGSYETSGIVSLVGAAGLGIGLALNPLVAGIVAGVMAIYERAYRTGDWVEVGGHYGVVTSVGLRSFKLVTPDDTEVTVPHSRLWSDNIANANSGSPDHLVVADFYLAPAHDARQVRQKLWDVGITSPYTHLSRPVVVVLREKPWATHYRLKAYPLDGRDEFQFISDLTVRGKAALAELGTEPAPALPVPDHL